MSAYLQGQDPAANDAPKPVRKAVTAPALLAMRAAGDKIAMLTAYDASFASLMCPSAATRPRSRPTTTPSR